MKLLLIHSLLLSLTLFGCNTGENLSVSEIESPASENSLLPRLFTDNTGSVWMSWVEEVESKATLKFSKFDGELWTAPSDIASDTTWFVNWADYPSVIARNGEPMAAHWLNKVKGGTYAYHVNMATFDDEWNSAFTPHKDNTPTEHGFVSMTPATDSTFMAIWLDGRNTDNRDHNEYSDINKAMTLRGALISKESKILHDFLIDGSVCDCCNTSVAKTDKGFIAAYRNRTSAEIRDIYVASFIDGNWNKPKPVHSDNWEIAACPVNGPAIDAQDETVAVAWFTGANGEAKVKLALSEDYGNTFNKPITLDQEAPIGRVDLNMTNNKIWISWLANGEDEAMLQIRAYSIDGVALDAFTIPNLSRSRNSGFPHISISGDGLMVAYTDVSGESSRVKTLNLN